MLVKIISLFLVFIAVLALFGRLRFGKRRQLAARCPSCGRHRIGSGPCPCGRA
jgi:hypothetical protein